MDKKDNIQNEGAKVPNVHSDIPEISSIPPLPDQGPTSQESTSGTNSNNYTNQQTFQNKNYQQQNQGFQQQANQHNYNNAGNQYRNPIQIKLPNSGGVLTLGILSILSICCCGPFLGPILAVIALLMVPKAKRLYNQNPTHYKESSLKNLKAGQILAIIGLGIAVLIFIYIIIMWALNPQQFNEVREVFDESWNQMGY
ncbi:MAG: hypothetical protein C0596_16595 [Marinilabiliales bacterium]|nr:MAG: hypothetical protein C0596_16595 [Marinilabiliales bacterium]